MRSASTGQVVIYADGVGRGAVIDPDKTDFEGSGQPVCRQRHVKHTWICTRMSGHTGPHIAHLGRHMMLSKWWDVDPVLEVEEGL